jgi:hypothetical protein
VAVPTEHGGWSFTLEPALLGILIAPSAAGAALAGAALLAFLLRTPLKLVGVDRVRGRRLERTRVAVRVAALESIGLAALVATAALLATGPFWIPLAAAAPLVIVQLAYDVRSRSRRLAPELAGTIGIGAVAAAIVLAAGGSPPDAFGAWLLVSARAVASVVFVRLQLLRFKGRGGSTAGSDLTQLGAVAAAGAGWAAGLLPVAAFAAVTGLAAIQVVLARRPPPRVAVLGAQQVVLGLTVVVVGGLALLAP